MAFGLVVVAGFLFELGLCFWDPCCLWCCFVNFLIVFSVVISVLFLTEDGLGIRFKLNWFGLVIFCETFD